MMHYMILVLTLKYLKNDMGNRNMSDFTNNFTNYEDCVPAGVRLPNIKIENNIISIADASPDISNFDFLENYVIKEYMIEESINSIIKKNTSTERNQNYLS